MTFPDHLIDKRVLERNIAKGLVDRKEYDRSLSQLQDMVDNVEVVEPFSDGELEGDEEATEEDEG